MATVTGGELVARTLERAGVANAFGIHGGHLETMFQACHAHGIVITDHRDEAAAGHAAEGYAKARRALGVALATAGPGVTNIITSIANAHHDRTPVLYLTGSALMAHAETNMVQAGIDNVALARPLTKWAHRITVTSDIPRLVAHAIRVATTAPCGPVLLEFPVDISFAMVDEITAAIPDTIYVDAVAAPQAARVTEALDLLARAERPVLLAGEGAWWSGAAEELRRFVDTTGIPVFTHYQGQGLIPTDHPLHGGTFFKLAEFTDANSRPDVVLALGTRLGVDTLGRSGRVIPDDAALIQIDDDPTEIGRIRRVDVPIVADPLEAIVALNASAGATTWPDCGPWQKTVDEAKAERREQMGALAAVASEFIHPYLAATAVVDAVGDDAIIVGDGAEAHQWLAEVVRRPDPERYFTHGQFACLGFGLGFAIGAQVAHPDREVLLVTGDGGVGFTIAEFDTMTRHRLPIVVVVFNNRAWGATRHFQEIFSAGRYTATELADTRYDLVAEGFGCRGQLVTDLGELGPAIRAGFESGRPTCINVAIEFAPMPPDAAALMSSF